MACEQLAAAAAVLHSRASALSSSGVFPTKTVNQMLGLVAARKAKDQFRAIFASWRQWARSRAVFQRGVAVRERDRCSSAVRQCLLLWRGARQGLVRADQEAIADLRRQCAEWQAHSQQQAAQLAAAGRASASALEAGEQLVRDELLTLRELCQQQAAELSCLRDNGAGPQSDLLQLTQLCEEQLAEIEELRKQALAPQRDLRDLQQLCQQQALEIRELRRLDEGPEDELKSLQETCNEQASEIERLEGESRGPWEEMRQLQETCNEQASEIERLEGEARGPWEEMQQLQDFCGQREAELEGLRQQAEAAQELREGHHAEMEALRAHAELLGREVQQGKDVQALCEQQARQIEELRVEVESERTLRESAQASTCGSARLSVACSKCDRGDEEAEALPQRTPPLLHRPSPGPSERSLSASSKSLPLPSRNVFVAALAGEARPSPEATPTPPPADGCGSSGGSGAGGGAEGPGEAASPVTAGVQGEKLANQTLLQARRLAAASRTLPTPTVTRTAPAQPSAQQRLLTSAPGLQAAGAARSASLPPTRTLCSTMPVLRAHTPPVSPRCWSLPGSATALTAAHVAAAAHAATAAPSQASPGTTSPRNRVWLSAAIPPRTLVVAGSPSFGGGGGAGSWQSSALGGVPAGARRAMSQPPSQPTRLLDVYAAPCQVLSAPSAQRVLTPRLPVTSGAVASARAPAFSPSTSAAAPAAAASMQPQLGDGSGVCWRTGGSIADRVAAVTTMMQQQRRASTPAAPAPQVSGGGCNGAAARASTPTLRTPPTAPREPLAVAGGGSGGGASFGASGCAGSTAAARPAAGWFAGMPLPPPPPREAMREGVAARKLERSPSVSS